MRRQTGNGGLEGKDMNIAVLDSGVDREHHSIGSRVELVRDFTGEGRADDPYGHGTHVASLAAGSDHVAHGAYVGPAPEAKIISLRVLDAQGVGLTSNVLRALQWVLAPVDPNKPSGEKNRWRTATARTACPSSTRTGPRRKPRRLKRSFERP
ncbi:MAG TPA: S8 family serine peptidase [Pyrinomonadaceae bacterium]|nr:S8 family serine peptidase [Pyrinomonadaceae bacterium]